MYSILLNLINLIHVIIILFILVVPFTSHLFLLFVYFVTVPFIMLHWLINNDTCALTIIEQYLRIKLNNNVYVPTDKCISYKLFSPIYNFTKNSSVGSMYIWLISIVLYSIVYYKLPLRQVYNCINLT